MPTTHDTALWLKWKAEAEHLSLSNRLRLCADLIEQDKPSIAESIASDVVDALRTLRRKRNGNG